MFMIFGFGCFLNVFGCFITFWMIRGYAYSLGNAVIFLTALFYILGIIQFEIFLTSNPDTITVEFSDYQFFMFAAVLILIMCYFIGRHWSNVIAKLNKI